MDKRIIFLLSLTFCVAFPTYAFAFTDVSGHWAEEAINSAANNGIIEGYYDNTFKPNNYMTRAELITVIDNMLGIESESDSYIADSTRKDWYYSNLRKAIYFGIIQGDQKGRYNPNSRVTREEAVTMLARAFKVQNSGAEFKSEYEDADDISKWARSDFMSFIRKGFINGYDDNSIRPDKNITRAEIITVINRIIKNVKPSMSYIKITGNTLIKDRNTILNNAEIYGNLIVGEAASKTIKFTNVIVNGDLVLFAPIDFEANTISVNGKIINAYDVASVSSNYYNDEEYGIVFPVPDKANTYKGMPESNNEYSKKDLIIVNTFKEDKYYFMNMSEVVKEIINKLGYDSIFEKTLSGDIQGYSYELYEDNTDSNLLIIKRDNVVYTIVFANVESKNIIDNVISNIAFTDGTEIINHENRIYRNSKLALKFSYKNGYVGVDDSYNTGNVYSGDSMFKLFIQVNMITDIDEYSIEQISSLLKSFVKNDGVIVKEEVMKLNNHNAIKFEIDSDNDKIISLYVIIGNNLYNFIFRGEANKIELLGKDMFNNIVNSMEF